MKITQSLICSITEHDTSIYKTVKHLFGLNWVLTLDRIKNNGQLSMSNEQFRLGVLFFWAELQELQDKQNQTLSSVL